MRQKIASFPIYTDEEYKQISLTSSRSQVVERGVLTAAVTVSSFGSGLHATSLISYTYLTETSSILLPGKFNSQM